jgi:hypothetical protein
MGGFACDRSSRRGCLSVASVGSALPHQATYQQRQVSRQLAPARFD